MSLQIRYRDYFKNILVANNMNLLLQIYECYPNVNNY